MSTQTQNTQPNKETNTKGRPAGPGGRQGRGGRGGQRPRRQESEFDQVIIDLARVTRVMAGGKRMSFRACVVIGDRKGRVGAALAKGADVTAAINKAAKKAEKNLINVPITNETIPHMVKSKFHAARVMLRPAPKGSGVISGGAVRPVLELAGISNVVGKIMGSPSKVNNVLATLKALESLMGDVNREKKTKKTDKKPVAKKTVKKESKESKK